MSYSKVFFNPIPTYYVPDVGTPTNVSNSMYSWIDVQRSDTIRRQRPRILNLDSGTGVYTQERIQMDSPCVFRNGNGTEYSSAAVRGATGAISSYKPYINLRTSLLNDVRTSARNSGVNLANAMAEYRQTASLFQSGITTFASMLHKFASRNPGSIVYNSAKGKYQVSHLKQNFGANLSNRVLEFQYGVKPLIDDILGSIAAIKKASEDRPVITHLRSRRSANDSGTGKYGSTKYSWTYNQHMSAKSEVTYKNDVLNASLGQFGFTNPLAVLWEIATWSHVVDWWFNVGAFLGSLDSCLYIDKIVTQVSLRENYFCTGTETYGSQCTYSDRILQREAPQLISSVLTLSYKPSLSLQHILNGTAHLGQILLTLKK